MNKTAIKNFAVEARKKLIASIKDKAGRIGIGKDKITDPISKGEGYAVFPTHIGIEAKLTGKEVKQRETLVSRIQSKENGYEIVIEEVAYTWFNRLIAIRFMEVNDYLPTRIRVLSSETVGKFEPDIVTQAPQVDLEFSRQEVEEVLTLKENNAMDQLFRMLFIKQCNELGKILPELFENTSKENKDYTEILLDISYTNEDGVLRDLLKIDEADFLEATSNNNTVEIIGWLYQYYNEERRNEVINIYKGIVEKHDIPAATQLFTTDWIVRYMVDNSLGRYWIERNPDSRLQDELEFFLPYDMEYVAETISPEDIKVLDPCMGSGHILVYAFDVLMKIYEECGYNQRDAARLILQKNLYGLDIDDRAYQLAYFALLMRARKYNRKILYEEISPRICSIQESGGIISFGHGATPRQVVSSHEDTADYLIDCFKNAKEYGSLIRVESRNYRGLANYLEKLKSTRIFDVVTGTWFANVSNVISRLIEQSDIMTQKYDVVVTNPPYLNKMDEKLKDYLNNNYRKFASDLFSAFMFRNFEFCKTNGYCAFMTPFVWMFIKTYESLREFIINNKNISSLIQMEYSAFEEATVPICSFVLKNGKDNQKGTYIKLSEFRGGMDVQRKKVIHAISEVNCHYLYHADEKKFAKIPGMPIVYWVSDKVVDIFLKSVLLSKIAEPKQGIATADNNRFLRLWHEVSYRNCKFDCKNSDEARRATEKWYPYNKGGEYRKWYGNNDFVINWCKDGLELKSFKGAVLRNPDYYFRKCISWSLISSNNISFRYKPQGHLFDVAGMSCFANDDYMYYLLGLNNTCLVKLVMSALAPTINFQVGNIANIPVIIDFIDKRKIEELVRENIELSKNDWDSFETSWDFGKHPLAIKEKQLSSCYLNWRDISERRFIRLKKNEEELNRIFIGIYGLQDELTPEIQDSEVTVLKADLGRDIRSLMSYAIGCIFGRYNPDLCGIAYAGGKLEGTKYTTFIPVADNVLLVTDEEYFTNDIVAWFVEFVKVVYGQETVEENLDFIAEALGNKGTTSREIIRNYFLKDFYKDHVKTYQKRPIYWLFDSGKENGFKALIYMHRYDQDTVGRVRADYLHKTQFAIENAIAHCDVVLENNAAASEKAKAVKQKEEFVKQLAETRLYDQAFAHVAHQRIDIDLDDGVVVNYAKFQGVEVANEGKRVLKIDLLAKI